MDRSSILSALSLANYTATILCGIVFFIFAGTASAEESADKVHIDAKSFRCRR